MDPLEQHQNQCLKKNGQNSDGKASAMATATAPSTSTKSAPFGKIFNQINVREFTILNIDPNFPMEIALLTL